MGQQLRDMAAARRESVALIWDIAFTFVAPGAGRALRTALQELGEQAITLASGSLANADQIIAVAGHAGKSAAQSSFGQVTDQTAVDTFLTRVSTAFDTGCQAVDGQLASRSDGDLYVLYAACHPSNTTVSHYTTEVRALVDRYRSQVVSVGRDHGPFGANTQFLANHHTRAGWITTPRGRRLAQVRLNHDGSRRDFVRWVEPEFEADVLARAREQEARPHNPWAGMRMGYAVREYTADQVRGIPAEDLARPAAPRARRPRLPAPELRDPSE